MIFRCFFCILRPAFSPWTWQHDSYNLLLIVSLNIHIYLYLSWIWILQGLGLVQAGVTEHCGWKAMTWEKRKNCETHYGGEGYLLLATFCCILIQIYLDISLCISIYLDISLYTSIYLYISLYISIYPYIPLLVGPSMKP